MDGRKVRMREGGTERRRECRRVGGKERKRGKKGGR